MPKKKIRFKRTVNKSITEIYDYEIIYDPEIISLDNIIQEVDNNQRLYTNFLLRNNLDVIDWDRETSEATYEGIDTEIIEEEEDIKEPPKRSIPWMK